MSNSAIHNQKQSKDEIEHIDDETGREDSEHKSLSPTSRYIRVAVLFALGLLLIGTGIKFLFSMFERPMFGLVMLPIFIIDLIWISLGAKAIIEAVKILMD